MRDMSRAPLLWIGGLALPTFLAMFFLMGVTAPKAGKMSLGDMETEIRKLEDAFRNDSEDPNLRVRLVRAYHQMSVRLVDEGELNEALHYLEWADDLGVAAESSQAAPAYVNMGMAALERGNLAEARKNFDLAVAKDEGNEALRKNIAVSIHNAGVAMVGEDDRKEATKLFELSTQYYKKIDNTWEVLGDLAYQDQQLREALAYWKKSFAFGGIKGAQIKNCKARKRSESRA